MSEPEDPFYRKVADYFIMRRGRGVVLAASDHDRLRTWRERGAHHFDVMEAIDVAFRKSREAPSSLAAVAPYIQLPPTSAESEFDALFSDESEQPAGAMSARADNAPTAHDGEDEGGEQLLDTISGVLRGWEHDANLDNAAQVAAGELRRELRELSEDGDGIDSETLTILDDAYALNAFHALDPATRSDIEQKLSETTRPFDPRDRPKQLQAALRASISYPRDAIADAIKTALRAR